MARLLPLCFVAAVAFAPSPLRPPWRTTSGYEPPPRVVILSVDASAY